MVIDNPEERINSRKAYSRILQIKNAIISHSPNFNPIKYLNYFKDKEKKDKYKEIYEEINKKSNKKINLDNTFEDKEIFCLVMEFAKNGSLESYYDDYKNRFKDKEHFLPLDEKLIIKIFKQLLNGVNYLHSKRVIHGNIKTNNILLDEKNNIKFLILIFQLFLKEIMEIKMKIKKR